MKQYILIIKSSGKPSAEEGNDAQDMVQKYIAWASKLREEGRYVAADGVTDEIRVLTNSRDSAQKSQGNYDSDAGMIGGYYIFTASSFDEAEEIARGCPALERGATLELREEEVYS